MYRAKIDVTLKKTVLDPQGKTVRAALHSLDFTNVEDIRVGKFFDMRIDATSDAEAKKIVATACDKLLVNAVIEEYSFSLEKV